MSNVLPLPASVATLDEDAWDDLLVEDPDPSRFTGLCFYEWDVYASGGPDDTGYGVRGKPAHELLKEWFARVEAAR